MRNKVIFSALLIAVTMGIFARTAGHQFINFDDPGYITRNPVVKGGLTTAGVVWAFTSTAMSNWHPVTWLSHMADVQLFGLDPAGHHMVSVMFHCICAVLLFLFLDGVTGFTWRSLTVALLFALHPLHVESFAWVAERKDVLSALFWLLTLICYAAYVKKPGIRLYLLSLFSFILGLMAKPMLVTLPMVMLLLDYWPFNRYKDQGPLLKNFIQLVKEKVPFFLLAFVSSLITVYAQHKGGAMATLVKVPVDLRIENAFISYVKYIILMFWPHDMAILYPFNKSLSHWQAAGAGFLLLAVSLAVTGYRRRFPYLVTGWYWYLLTLLPVIGLVQVGGQAMADRYTYIPFTGLFIVVCWLVPDLMGGWRHKRLVLGTATVIAITSLVAVTWRQLGFWKDELTLYRHTLAVTRDNYLILNNYGIALDERGDLAGAYGMFQETLRVNPRSAMAYNNIGALFVRWGNFADAVSYYNRALEIIPDYAYARSGMGKALAGMGRLDEAIWQYEQALKIDPSLYETHISLAVLLIRRGRPDGAMAHYEAALRLEPSSPKAPTNIGAELAAQGRMEEALDYFTYALSLDPNSVEARFNRGVALAKLGRREEAVQEFSRVLVLMPGSDAARYWLEKLKSME